MTSTFPVDNRTAAGSQTQAQRSNLKAQGGYGQNGFLGASSTNPGEVVNTGFLPQVTVPKDDWQTRQVKADAYPKSFGMKDVGTSFEKIPAKNNRG